MAYSRLKMVRGDTHVYNLSLKDSNGVPYCLKNWSIAFTVKDHYDRPDSESLLQKVITVFPDSTGGTSGLAQIVLQPRDTVNMSPGEYDCDIQVTTSTGENYTVWKGKFELEYDVTRTPGTAGTS